MELSVSFIIHDSVTNTDSVSRDVITEEDLMRLVAERYDLCADDEIACFSVESIDP